MSTSFRKTHPDFASIEHHIRRAHAERQLAIATAIADGIMAVIRSIGRLAGRKAVAVAQARTVKVSVPRPAARV